MFCIDCAIDGGVEHDTPAFLQTDESIAPRRGFGAETRAGDRDQSPAGGKTGQGRGNMPVCGISDAAAHIGHDREWRVHQHDGRDGIGGQMIVDLGGIKPGDGEGRKERGQ